MLRDTYAMPTIHIHMFPRSDAEKKKIVEGITRVFEDIGVKRDVVNIIFHEIPKNSYATGGRLLSES